MPTPAVMTLLEMTPRPADVDGFSFQIGRRTKWEVRLDLAKIAAGITGLSVDIQSAPRDEDAEYTSRKLLGPYTSADDGTTVVVHTEASQAANLLTIPATDHYVRAIVTSFAGSGTYHLEARAMAAFLDPQDGTAVADLPKRLREWKDGLPRTIWKAERVILDQILERDGHGHIDADLQRADSLDLMRAAIRAQAVLLYRRHEMERSKDASTQVSLRELPEVSAEARELLEPLMPLASQAPWRGR